MSSAYSADYDDFATPIGLGHTEAGGSDGVILGIGDTSINYLAEISGDIAENPGGADDDIQVPDFSAVLEGLPFRKLTGLFNLDQTAADGPLAVGEHYWALMFLSPATGAFATLKSNAFSGAPDPANVPALPAGEQIGYVQVDHQGGGSSIITNAEITNTYTVGAYAFSASGLTATIGPGRARVDNFLVRHTFPQQLTLLDATFNSIWLNPDGTLTAQIFSAPRPTPRSYLLHQVLTAAGAVVVVIDQREFVGAEEHVIDLVIADPTDPTTVLAVGDEGFGLWPFYRVGYIRPVKGITVRAHDAGAGGGQLKLDVTINGTSIYTSSASDDRRPVIPSGAVIPPAVPTLPLDTHYRNDAGNYYEVTAIALYAIIQAEVIEIPAGTANKGVHVRIVTVRP